jgi:hypothetical protein
VKSDPTENWPACLTCGKRPREGKHATDLGEGHDYVPDHTKPAWTEASLVYVALAWVSTHEQTSEVIKKGRSFHHAGSNPTKYVTDAIDAGKAAEGQRIYATKRLKKIAFAVCATAIEKGLRALA